MNRPTPAWEQWPHKERAQRRSKKARKRVRGGRYYVMKAPESRRRTDGRDTARRWVAINFTKKGYRYFHTWQEAWDFAVEKTRQAYNSRLDAGA